MTTTNTRPLELESIDAGLTECRSCRAQARWGRTARNRKAILIEAQAVVTERPDGILEVPGDAVHFVNCPNAEKHRKRGEAATAEQLRRMRALVNEIIRQLDRGGDPIGVAHWAKNALAQLSGGRR